MSDKFDWHSADDLDWDALPDDEEKDVPSPKRRRWLFVLVALLFIAGALGLILRQINRRVDENTQAMRTDIISSFNLLQIADVDKDGELFFSLLSGSDSSWTAAQRDLFEADLFYNRTPLGLSAHQTRESALSAEDDDLTITLSPELREAEVVAERPFAIEIGHSLTETVVLKETTVYRLGRERWLLSPPSGEFWGSEITRQSSRLHVTAPERDAEIVERLHADLERKLDEMCQALSELDCLNELAVDVQFSTDPASLAALKDPAVAQRVGSSLQVELPTPTLVGLPVDESAYQALFRGYAAQFVSAVISNLVEFTCCRHAAFHQALLDHQLNELSLKPWPVNDIDYQRILDEQLQIVDLDTLWRSEDIDLLHDPEGWRIYAFLDYLLGTYPTLNSITLQRELVTHESMYGWLDDALLETAAESTSVSSRDLIRQFWIEAYAQTFAINQDGQGPLPAQDLQLICAVPDESSSSNMLSQLYRYDIAQDIWSVDYRSENTLFMNPMPDDNGLFLVEYDPFERGWQTFLWKDRQANPILSQPDQFSISFGDTDPDGSSLTTFVFTPDRNDALITLFDLEQCDRGGCDSRLLPGIPIWSPDGTQAIFSDEPNLQLALLQSRLRTILFDPSADTPALRLFHAERQELMGGEVVEQVSDLSEIGEGHAPFWLDNETVGFVALANGRFSRPGQEVMVTPSGKDQSEVLFTANELVATLPNSASVERIFWIHYVMVHPMDPDLLFVVAMSGWDQQAYLFTYDLENRQVQYLMENNHAADHTLSLSPDGRFQVMTGRDLNHLGIERGSALLLLHDLNDYGTIPFLIKPSEFSPFLSYDWSKDGSWLAMMFDDDLIGLFAPERDELILIENAPGNCSSPVWINQ
ncbi:MAG: hypothetical protein R3293_05060 [Candidatus Promineifilaceae bacterium]|nr:hypothetical protein [Candidatus Promineifilaceae bacterium]